MPGGIEQVIPAANSLEATVRQVMRDTGLACQRQELACGNRPLPCLARISSNPQGHRPSRRLPARRWMTTRTDPRFGEDTETRW